MSDPRTAPPPAQGRKVTLATLAALRVRGEKAVFVTAYDYPTAVFADRAGVDLMLVGDSAAMTMLGHANTLAITMTEMLVFARAVARGAQRAFVVGDLPFLSYQASNEDAVRNAGAFLAAGCDAVKCEGGARVASRVRAMTDAGIAVMGHLGLTPQAAGQQGGYRVQGKTLAAAERVLEDALALQAAGVFAILFEALPSETAAFVRERLNVIAYGIGAGPDLDGQLVISHDILGNFVGEIRPKFVSRFANLDAEITGAFRAYARAVREGAFPSPEHCYEIDAADEAAIRSARRSRALPFHVPGGSPVPATLFLPAVLAKLANGKQLAAHGSTVGALVADVSARFPALAPRLRDAEGNPYPYVTFYLNDEDIRFHGGFAAAVKDGDELTVVPAIAGG